MPGENKLGVMPISKLIWNMSLPIIASMLVQALYNIVDSVFVSWVSEASLTAVSLAFPAQNLMISLGAGTAVGVNALMGRALGAGERDRANRVAVNGLFLALVAFVLCSVLGLTCAEAFMRSQTKVEEIVQMGAQYLNIVMGCSFGLFGQIMLERLLQGTGRSLLSMYTQGLGAIINIILDPVFIFAFGMGVTGAAIATVIGQICGMLLAAYFNVRKNHDLTLRVRGFRPDWRLIGGIYAIGLPSVIMMAIGSVMTFLMNKILIVYHSAHETAATAFGIYFKLNSFVFMPVFGLSNGLVAIVGYNYGAHLRERVYAAVRVALRMAIVIMAVGMLLFMTIPQVLLSLFEAEGAGDLTAVGCPALRVISLSFILAAVGITLGTVFQAVGKGVYSLINSLCRQLMVLLPAAWLLSRLGGLSAVWWSFPIAEVVSLAVCLLLYRRVDRTMLKTL